MVNVGEELESVIIDKYLLFIYFTFVASSFHFKKERQSS
jgi:hypothetical protein